MESHFLSLFAVVLKALGRSCSTERGEIIHAMNLARNGGGRFGLGMHGRGLAKPPFENDTLCALEREAASKAGVYHNAYVWKDGTGRD